MPKYEDKKLGLTPGSLPGFLQIVARQSPQALMLKNQGLSEADQQVHTREGETIIWKCESKEQYK